MLVRCTRWARGLDSNPIVCGQATVLRSVSGLENDCRSEIGASLSGVKGFGFKRSAALRFGCFESGSAFSKGR